MEEIKKKIVIGFKNKIDQDLIARSIEKYEVISLQGDNYKTADLVILDKFFAHSIGKNILEFKFKQDVFLPVIVVLDKNEEVDSWLSAGFDEYLQKPFTKIEFHTRIKLLLNLREYAIELQKRGETLYRAIFEATGTATLIVDEDTTILLANNECFPVTGYTPSELIGTSWVNYVAPESLELMLNYHNLRRTDPEKVPSKYEVKLIHKNSSVRDVILFINLIPGTKKTVVSMLDVTEQRNAERELAKSMHRYKHLTDISPVGIFHTDEKGSTTYVNEKWCEISGLSCIEALGDGWLKAVHPEDRELIMKSWQKDVISGKPSSAEYRFLRPDGKIAWVIGRAVPEKDAENNIIGYTGIIVDITERKLAEEKLRLQGSALEASANAIVIANREGFIQWSNEAFTRLTGYQVPDEVFGRNPRDLVKSGMQDRRFYEDMWNTILAGKVWHGELINRRKDGSLYDEEMTITPVKDEQGLITHFIAVKQDISDRKLRERELQREKDFVQSITETSPVGIIRVNRDGTIVYANSRTEEILGLTRSKIIGQRYNAPIFRISGFNGEEFPDEQLPFYRVKNELKSFTDISHAINWPDGRRVLLSINAAPLFDERGEFDGMVATFEDITERIQAEQKIQEREQWFRRLADTTATAIVIYQGDKFVYVNKAAQDITGYSSEELFAMHFWDVVHPEYRELVRERGLSRQLGADVPSRYEFKILRKDGKEIWIDYTAGRIDWFGQPAAIGTAVDITERKKAEEDLKRSYEQYELFFKYDLTGDYISTVEGKIIACNPAFLKIFGFSSIEEALKIDANILYESPEDRARLLSRLQREKKIEYYELQMRKLDGTPLHIVANIIGIFDENDKLVQMQGYLFDDTKRKSLENMLIQAQKLESLGTLASGIAHDFNNILAIILGHASLLKIHTQDPNKISQSVEAITRATERGSALVKQMLTFARKTEISLQPLDLNILIKEIGKMMNETFPKIIEIKLNLKSNLPPILADVTQIHQVLLNLCVNARDAMPKGGKLTISTEIADLKKLKEHFSNISESAYVTVIVSDTGIGMDEETKTRIFEPFFTTKPAGQGTGLGLSVVHGIISAHKGFVRVESEPGQGTTFYVYIPCMEIHQKEDISISKSEEEIKGGKETILIIEDEQYLKQMLEELLIAKGYTVITAENGAEGVELYTKNHKNIDLIITDMGLPKLDGKEVFYKILKINPDAKVIIASGYIEPSLKSQLYKDGLKDFITKPYSFSEILKKIRAILDFP